MMCIISKENSIWRAGRRNARRDIRIVTQRLAIPMQALTQWTHSDVLSLFATIPEWSFKIGDRQNAKRQWNRDRRAIYNATRCIDAGCGVIRHRSVSDGSDGARPLWRSHSARTEYFSADVQCLLRTNCWVTSCIQWWYKCIVRWPVTASCGIVACIQFLGIAVLNNLNSYAGLIANNWNAATPYTDSKLHSSKLSFQVL